MVRGAYTGWRGRPRVRPGLGDYGSNLNSGVGRNSELRYSVRPSRPNAPASIAFTVGVRTRSGVRAKACAQPSPGARSNRYASLYVNTTARVPSAATSIAV